MAIAQIIGPLFTLVGKPFEAYRRRKERQSKEEILRLLRDGKWGPGPRAFVGMTGRLLVYDGELMDASPQLKKLGEYRLHQLLRELQAEGMINCAEHERNRWFALY